MTEDLSPDAGPRTAGSGEKSSAAAPEPAVVLTGRGGSGRSRLRLERGIKGTIGVAGAILLWELARATGLLPSVYAPSFPRILSEAVQQIPDGPLMRAVLTTLHAWALGLGIAVLLAVPSGFAVGLSRWADSASRVVVEFLRPIPSVALIPVAILFAGLGLQMKLILIVFACFWPLFFNTKYGVGHTDPLLLETGRAFGRSRPRLILEIVVPSALPSVATGVRIAASIALILAVVAEMVAGGGGIGYFILAHNMAGQLSTMYAGILVIGLLGYAVNLAAMAVERRLLAWSPDHRQATR
jgi:NitT/TauT family transport system permease protein